MILILIGTFSTCIPLFFGFLYYKKLSMGMKILIWYLVSAFVLELIVELIILFQLSKNTSWLTHLFTPIEYIFWSIIFARWQSNVHLKQAILWSIFFVVGFMIINTIFFQPITHNNSYGMGLERCILTCISAFTLFEISKEGIYPLWKDYRFWIVGGCFFYNLTTLIMLSLVNTVILMGPQIAKLWLTIHAFLNIISYLIYAEGFLCHSQAQKSG